MMRLTNDLGLQPPKKAVPTPPPAANFGQTQSAAQVSSTLKTEFEFTLPKGYLDGDGNLHRKGVMRLSRAIDEIVPMRDPRVRSNPAYATVIILSRVITRLGALEEISPAVIEGLFACDLNYLQKFYRHINDLEEGIATEQAPSQNG
ncbi:MAG: phage tail assembly protein [Chroococcales cyanobacterium]